MTDRSKLLALAEAVATAHEVETRALIEQAFDACHPRQLPAPAGFVHWNPLWSRLTTLFGAKAYLDAAMVLVPKGWQTLGVEQSHDGAEWIWRLYPSYRSDAAVFGQSTTPALALTAACLRARAQAEALA